MASRLHVVQALYGDTLVLEYDNNLNGESGFILVDGGPNKSYRLSGIATFDTTKNLFDLLTHLSGRKTRKLETINTVVVTHDDADHKNGIAQLFDYLTQNKKKSPTMMSWTQGIRLMEAKNPPIENIWYNSQEGLTRQYMDEFAKNMTPAEEKQLLETLKGKGFIDDNTMPTLGWFGKFLVEYNLMLNSKFKIIGKHSKSKPITKGAITADILGPIIPWSKNSLWKLMYEVKNVSDWSVPDDVLDAKGKTVNIDLKSTATVDSAARNKSSVIFRANYVSKDGKKRGVLMLGDAPMSEALKKQLFPKDMEYAIVKIAHHGSAHNNFLSTLHDNPDISGELSWVKLDRGSVLQKAFLYFLTLHPPKYVISASTSFGSPNPHISTILGIYLAAAARHMRYVYNHDVSDPRKWKVDIYMTGRLSPNAKREVAEFISNPKDSDISSLNEFVIPGDKTTKVINYIKDYTSHMTIWGLKLDRPYGSISILDESGGNDQWVRYDVVADAQGSKRVHDNTRATGTLNPGTSSRPPKMPKKPSFKYL